VYLAVPSLELRPYLPFILIVGSKSALIAVSSSEAFCNMHFVCTSVVPCNQSVPFLKCHANLQNGLFGDAYSRREGTIMCLHYNTLPINALDSFIRRTFDPFFSKSCCLNCYSESIFFYCQYMHLLVRSRFKAILIPLAYSYYCLHNGRSVSPRQTFLVYVIEL
jgi:hypothetical protein